MDQSVICFDLDKTIIDTYSEWKRNALICMKAFPCVLDGLWALYSEQIPDKHGTLRFKATIGGNQWLAPSGTALSLAWYGLYGKKGKKLQSIIPYILDIHCEYTDLIPGVECLLAYLVDAKKYSIVYATNKDYLTYTLTQKKIDIKNGNIFGQTPTFVLLAHPTKTYLDRILSIDNEMPVAFQNMLRAIQNAGEEDTVFFAPEDKKKPADLYYTLLKKKIKQAIPHYGNIIFFDDKQYNVDAAKRNGIKASYQVHENTQLKDIVNGLESEKLLCKEKDSLFYKKIESFL